MWYNGRSANKDELMYYRKLVVWLTTTRKNDKNLYKMLSHGVEDLIFVHPYEYGRLGKLSVVRVQPDEEDCDEDV